MKHFKPGDRVKHLKWDRKTKTWLEEPGTVIWYYETDGPKNIIVRFDEDGIEYLCQERRLRKVILADPHDAEINPKSRVNRE